MAVKIVTPPSVTPAECIGLISLKQHLRVADELTDEDELITAYCAAAWDYAGRVTWRQYLTATLRLTLPGWLCPIPIPRPPTASVASIEYYDENNDLQTWDAANYRVDLDSDTAEIWPVDDVGFPTIYSRHDAVRVNYVAGYGTTAAAMPAVFLHAVRLLVAMYYETREPAATETTAVDALLDAIACRDERLPEFV